MNRKRRALKLVKTEAPDAPMHEVAPSPMPAVVRPVQGHLSGITPEGRLLVTWGDAGEAVEAWIAAGASAQALLEAAEARGPVLLDFIEGDVQRPVILALLRERIEVDGAAAPRAIEPHLEIRAGEDLTLACGQSAIRLHQDGRVTIRGTEVESISAGANKIKGANVVIN